MTDLTVTLAGMTLKNPVVVATGTFGFGHEYGEFYDLSELGGICVKGLTPRRREGNPAPRIAETPMGILNSVGLQNPGVDEFIRAELPYLKQFDTRIIANISGDTPEEYGVMCEKLSAAGVDMIEVNISCPNVKAGGLAYGTRPELAAEVTGIAKAHSTVPVMVKLSPNVTDVTEIARAVEGLGGVRRGADPRAGHGGRGHGRGRRPAHAGGGLRRGGGHRLLCRPLRAPEGPGRPGGPGRPAGAGAGVSAHRGGQTLVGKSTKK